ncbi:MAG TPA: SDR family oxidoreductase [Stellaceae bacterium]|nr:SDR family oxidoreductase [Stellaceae bacterium]
MPIPDLKGTVVIVTGAAGGLGSAMTLALLEAGASVAAFDLESSSRFMDELLSAARDRQAGNRVRPFWCDVRNPAQAASAITAAETAFGRVDGLVNNAGLGPVHHPDPKKPMRFYEVDVDIWKSRIDTNLTGPFIMARTLAPRLIAQGRGKIVNVTTSYTTMVRETPYGPAKAGLEAATAIWAKDMAGTGVTANVLVPGGMANTRMVPTNVAPDRQSLIQPDVMRAPIQWLMSRDSDGVTGKRYIGREWDPNLDPNEAAEKVGKPAAW